MIVARSFVRCVGCPDVVTCAAMRVHLRRTTLYALLGAGSLLFLLTLQQNSHHLAQLEENVVIEERPPRDVKGDVINVVAPNIWESGDDKWNDRILDQLQFIPKSYNGNFSALKYIFVPGGLYDTPLGQLKFQDEQCAVDRCYLTTHRDYATKADAVLIQNTLEASELAKVHNQIWILWLLESPLNSIGLDWLGPNAINWTASYRADSTIVTPYEKFVPFANYSGLPLTPRRNYAKGKNKMVAWFVSNCNTMNKRLEYAEHLRKLIPVDIYGACGPLRCTRTTRGNKCDTMLKEQYKFYLSFENSNCEYYITEKLFWNALLNDVVPIVMGARRADYLAAAPPGSYIHVEDFTSVEEMAKYVYKVHQNDDLYNQYFRWKDTGQFINTKFWCRMCAMLHDVNKPSMSFPDVGKWWRGQGSCTRDRWDEPNDLITKWNTLYMYDTS